MTQTALQQAEHVLRTAPDQAAAWYAYGQALCGEGQFQRAQDALRMALALAPEEPTYLRALVDLWVSIGEVGRAVQSLSSLSSSALGDVLGRCQMRLRCYDMATDHEELAVAIRRAEQLSQEKGLVPFVPPADAGRRPLRVAYLTAQFAQQPVDRFLLTNLRYHQREHFAVWVYDTGSKVAPPEEILELADRWVSVAGQTPEAFQQRLQQDQIDVLVDVDGYWGPEMGIGGGGLPERSWCVVGWRGAPWAGVADAFIGDAMILPTGQLAVGATEYLRMPFAAQCWHPVEEIPVPLPLAPSRDSGALILSSFNPLSNLTESVLEAWAEILRQLPLAQLKLRDEALTDPVIAASIRQRFERRGVVGERILCAGMPKEWLPRLLDYQTVDVALDTFPVCGLESACEALWMGVPVVTLVGRSPWQNATASALNAVGLPDLIATDVGQYIESVVCWALDLAGREQYRRDLRDLMALSPLCAGPLFMRHFEQQIQQFWQRQIARPLPLLTDEAEDVEASTADHRI